MNADFYDRALTRIKHLTIVVGLVGTAAMFFARGRAAAAGFLAGAGISYVNFELLSRFARVMGGSAPKTRGWALLIALRYAIVGVAPAEFFGTFEYTHKKSGRKVQQDMFPFHSWAFQEGLLHAENLGGDIELVLNKRCLIGAFPWR